MSGKFGEETVIIPVGESVMSALRAALEKKGQADRMDDESGIFIIDNVTIKSIRDGGVECEIEYEYGG